MFFAPHACPKGPDGSHTRFSVSLCDPGLMRKSVTDMATSLNGGNIGSDIQEIKRDVMIHTGMLNHLFRQFHKLVNPKHRHICKRFCFVTNLAVRTNDEITTFNELDSLQNMSTDLQEHFMQARRDKLDRFNRRGNKRRNSGFVNLINEFYIKDLNREDKKECLERAHGFVVKTLPFIFNR